LAGRRQRSSIPKLRFAEVLAASGLQGQPWRPPSRLRRRERGRRENAFSRRHASEFFDQITPMGNRGRREDRAPAGAHGPRAEKSTRQNHRLSRGYPAFPAQWLYGLYAISPVTMLVCHRHPRGARKRFTNLAPASERQDHATSPSAHTPLVAQKIAPGDVRPSRPVPDVRDDREPPLLWARDGRKHRCDLPDKARPKAATNWHDGQFAHGAHAICRFRSWPTQPSPTVPRPATPALDRSR
jgi:hypothetical protein